MDNQDWGWTTCRNLGWQRDNGTKYYQGRFKLANDMYSWTLQVVRFWSNHPHKAMSRICHSGKEPRVFEQETILI